MNDCVTLENYLLILKSNVEVYVHGTLESTFDINQKLLKKCLNTTIDCQRDTFELMVNQKLYNVECINKSAIKECLTKLK